MSESLFLKQLKDLMLLEGKSVAIAKEDFEKLLKMAESSLRITPDACNCSIDQYGCCINPGCVIHGKAKE